MDQFQEHKIFFQFDATIL